MQVTRVLGGAAVVAAGILLATSAPAAASTNSGWVYTSPSSYGGSYFDADWNGHPSYEKLTVCDNAADGYGVIGLVWPSNVGSTTVWNVWDPSDNGHCSFEATNEFVEGTPVKVQTCRYRTASDGGKLLYNCGPVKSAVA